MSQAPFMPLFCDAYLGDTMHLSLEEHGAYLKLLMITWRNNGQALPDNDRRIARMLGVTPERWTKRLRPVLVSFFDLSDGSWRQKRLEEQWKQSLNFIAGQRGKATRRWSNKLLKNNDIDDAAASAGDMPGACPPSPSPSPSPEEEENPPAEVVPFPARERRASSYAFEGKVIRLSHDHFNEWRTTYHAILDLMAELKSIDIWLDDHKRSEGWFHQTPRMLNQKHQEILGKRAKEKAWAERPIDERYPNEGVFRPAKPTLQ